MGAERPESNHLASCGIINLKAVCSEGRAAPHESGDVKIKISVVSGEVPIPPTWQFAENGSLYESVHFPCLQGQAAQFFGFKGGPRPAHPSTGGFKSN